MFSEVGDTARSSKRHCTSCLEIPDSGTLKRCAGCGKAWYCSKECQTANWTCHIFQCQPRRQINSADYLALAVLEDLLPKHPETCLDYGFTRCVTNHERTHLFGLYVGLINYFDVKPQTLHKWRLKGTLASEIKSTYEERGGSGYYSWFLANQHVLDFTTPAVPTEKLEIVGKRAILDAYSFTGQLPVCNTADEVALALKGLEDTQVKCHYMYRMLLTSSHPGPGDEGYVSFGFAACAVEEEEMALGSEYHTLIRRCTFDEFHDAYENGRFTQLFSAKGLTPRYDTLERILGEVGARLPHPSSYSLKDYILTTDSDPLSRRPSNAVFADYGFMNCKNQADKEALVKAYKLYFEMKRVDSRALHEACIRGETFLYLAPLVKTVASQPKRYSRLLRNVYPLSLS